MIILDIHIIFFKKPLSRKRVGIAWGEPNAQFGCLGESGVDLGDEDEVVLDEGDALDEDEAIWQEAEFDDEDDEQDEGQAVHNEKIAKTLKEKAIRFMAQKNINIDPEEEKITLQIFPRVCGILYVYIF